MDWPGLRPLVHVVTLQRFFRVDLTGGVPYSDPSQSSFIVEQVNRADVGQRRHDERAEVIERLVEVERARQHLAGMRKVGERVRHDRLAESTVLVAPGVSRHLSLCYLMMRTRNGNTAEILGQW